LSVRRSVQKTNQLRRFWGELIVLARHGRRLQYRHNEHAEIIDRAYQPKRIRGANVYQEVTRKFTTGDRIQFTEADSTRGIRKGELGTVMAISDANDLDVKLDRGTVGQPGAEQARHIEHGYAVEGIKSGAPEQVLFTQEGAVNEREAASRSSQGRELNLYTSDSSISNNQAQQHQVALPQQQQIETPANVIAPEPVRNEIRRSLGR
jgi:hypothetical protein